MITFKEFLMHEMPTYHSGNYKNDKILRDIELSDLKNYKIIGKILEYDLYLKKEGNLYEYRIGFIEDNKFKVIFGSDMETLKLEMFPKYKNLICEINLMTDSKYRGKYIASKLYEFLLEDYEILSGADHYMPTIKMWLRLLENKNYKLDIINFNDFTVEENVNLTDKDPIQYYSMDDKNHPNDKIRFVMYKG